MSRTYKDKHWKLRFPETFVLKDEYYIKIPYEYEYTRWDTKEVVTCTRYVWLDKPGRKTKKRKKCDSMYHWVSSTPSAWTRIMMNRPQRRRGRVWEAAVVRQSIDSLEDELPPDVGRKPHIYYW